MDLQVIGAGLGRTGTNSLKLALEQLLGGPCYHMFEVFQHPQHVPLWEAAVREEPVGWAEIFGDFRATVDWPGAAFWRELSDASPEALVLLSTRDSAEQWWGSVQRTILEVLNDQATEEVPEHLVRQRAMVRELMAARFTPNWNDGGAAMAAYERHNAAVRAEVPHDRLIDWRPSQGWGPICDRLGLPEPAAPFPHENRTVAFRANVGLSDE
jgi:Sulfotransferase domain